MKGIILLISAFVFIAQSNAQTPTFSNVDYVGDENPKHLLDVYIPEGLTKPAKTVVYIHGGAWAKGSKEGTFGHCRELFNANYVIVGINYRLSQDSIFPAQIYDCKTAIRFLKTHASTYLIDTCNIGITGTSAGGHLVALLGTSSAEKSLEAQKPQAMLMRLPTFTGQQIFWKWMVISLFRAKILKFIMHLNRGNRTYWAVG